MKINLERLTNFLVVAKKNTYASGKKPKLVNGFEEFEFEGRDFVYLDRYVGGSSFCGIETVSPAKEIEKPLWAMVYFGAILSPFEKDEKKIFKFLKSALMKVPVIYPFRGGSLNIKPFSYSNTYKRDITRFNGNEIILSNNEIVYRGYYSGGLIKE